MERKMRRKRQQLSRAETEAVLTRGTSGVLALTDGEGWPYAVPLSYVYAEGKLYFHSAREGHKLEAAAACGRASFCVVDQDQVVPQEYTTYFRSAIAFGPIRVLEGKDETMAALALLAERFNPGDRAGFQRECGKGLDKLVMLELDVERLTGKEAIELVRARQS